MNNKQKKLVYWSFVAIVLVMTFYIAGNVIYNNLTSWSKGPVHWHADVILEVCGTEILLPGPGVWYSNRVGSNEVHHHTDMRIHIEGVIKDQKQATLGNFFREIGGDLTATSITIPTGDDAATYRNGDECPDAHRGNLRVYVNDLQIENAPDYIIKPFQDVPPGDKIKIVFD